MRELRGEREETEGGIGGNRGGGEGEQRGEREKTEGMGERGWYVLRAVWGEVGGHGVMVRGCDGAVDTAAVWFPVV